MLRFSANRWWALVLTLCLSAACFLLLSVQSPSVAYADSGSQLLSSDPGAPGAGYGDPDVPIGPGQAKPGKQSVAHGGAIQVVGQSGARPVGDVATPSSVFLMRLRLFLLGLRIFYLRF
jgi:hypothetical protein